MAVGEEMVELEEIEMREPSMGWTQWNRRSWWECRWRWEEEWGWGKNGTIVTEFVSLFGAALLLDLQRSTFEEALFKE